MTIDESGDSGSKFEQGSSPFFVITAVIFRDSLSADACDRNIEELKRMLNLPRSYEFHFRSCRDTVRRKFLSAVAHDRFRYHCFIINKRKLDSKRLSNAAEFYRFAVEIVCDNARKLLKNAKIIIDQNGDRSFKNMLEKSLKSRMTEPDGTCLIRKVCMEHSHSNNLVQLADMICGAVGRAYCGKGKGSDEYHKLVKKQEERVQVWPK